MQDNPTAHVCEIPWRSSGEPRELQNILIKYEAVSCRFSASRFWVPGVLVMAKRTSAGSGRAKHWTFSLNLPFIMQEWKGFISCVMASQIPILKAVPVKMSISSSSYHNHDSYEEGYRQWLEMKTVLLFLCQLEDKNFSRPKVLGPWVREGKHSHEVKPSESFLLQWGLQHGASRFPISAVVIFVFSFIQSMYLKVESALLSFLLLQLWNSQL